MKNYTNLSAALLIFLVMGCGCPGKLAELAGNSEAPAPPPSTPMPMPTSTPTTTSAKGEYDVTIEKFDRIRNGMKRSDVEAIFGGKGTEYYSGKGGGSTFISVKYVGDSYKTIFVSYRNDRVTSKTQAGLK